MVAVLKKVLALVLEDMAPATHMALQLQNPTRTAHQAQATAHRILMAHPTLMEVKESTTQYVVLRNHLLPVSSF